MADEDVEMAEGFHEIQNHTEAGDKTSSGLTDRSAEGAGEGGASGLDWTEGHMDVGNPEMCKSFTDYPASSDGATSKTDREAELGTTVDFTEGAGAGDTLAHSPSGGGGEEDGTAMEEDRESPEGGGTQDGAASSQADPTASASVEDGTTAAGDANHSDSIGKKILDALRQQPRQVQRRSYRRRNQESAGSGSNTSNSDISDNDGEKDGDDDKQETDASTRSSNQRQQSNSDSSATESDDGEGAAEKEEEESESKTSTSDFCSDLEDELLAKRLPNPSWRAVPMLRARQLGGCAPRQRVGNFCSSAVGSAHMVSRFEKCCQLRHHEGCVNTLHFNQSGQLLASGSDDLNVVLWDWARQRPSLVYPSGHKSNVFQAKFMPYSGDTTIVSCSRDGQVRVAELSSTGICKSTKKLVQHKGSAHKLGLEPDSPVVFLTCGEDAAVFNVDLRTSKATKLVTVKEDVHKVALYTIHLNPMNTHEYCVGGRDHFVRVYDRRKATDEENAGLVKKFCPHHLLNSETRANVTCSVYSYNGQEILASYNDEDIYLFDSTHSDGAEYIHSYKGHRNNQTVKGVNFYGPQSQFVVSGSDCGNIFLWEKTTERIVQYMKGDQQGVVNCLEPHPSTAVLATSGLDHDVKIWMPTATEPTRLEGVKRTMYSNRREREEERSREPDMIDGHMLMFLMQHLRRRARRQAREAGEMESNSSSSDSDSSEDEDGDGDESGERSQCVPS